VARPAVRAILGGELRRSTGTGQSYPRVDPKNTLNGNFSWLGCPHPLGARCPYNAKVLFTIEPKDLRRAQRIIASVGEDEFRRAVHEMTQFDTEALSLDDVICVYVLALEGRVQPPGAGRRAGELYPTLPPATADDPCVSLETARSASQA
jgi:hypothetical protein